MQEMIAYYLVTCPHIAARDLCILPYKYRKCEKILKCLHEIQREGQSRCAQYAKFSCTYRFAPSGIGGGNAGKTCFFFKKRQVFSF